MIDTPYTPKASPARIRGEPASFPQLEVATEKPLRRAGGDLDYQRADCIDQSAARFRRSAASRADGLPLGDRLEGRSGRFWPVPFLQEPVTATITWRRKGNVRAYVLTNEGDRISQVVVKALPGGEGVSLQIDGKTPAFHWELIVE